MRQYELTYLISDNVSEPDLNKVTGKVGGYVKDSKGKVLKEEIWGRRKLAYPIQKQEFATYVTVNFDLPAENARDFEHNIKMTSKIIRHLMIVKDFGEETLTLTAEDIAEANEIKDVIGGEKSFEVIEGETEGSKDLMAVRGDAASTESGAGTPASTESGMRRKKTELEVEEKIEEESKSEEKLEIPIEKITEKVETEEKESKKKKKQAEPKAAAEPEKKKPKAKKAKAEDDNEADRLSKLDKELDDILGEDLK